MPRITTRWDTNPPQFNNGDIAPVTLPLSETKPQKNPRAKKKKQSRYATKKTELFEHTVVSSYYEEYPLFKIFNEQYFFEHQLPSSALSYRTNPAQSVEGKELKQLIEHLRAELAAGKKEFTHFTKLFSDNFNFSNQAGLIIFKFKNYPFVLKLFQETPATLLDPHSKGLVPISFHYMAGGANRHILGFSRIRNWEIIKNRIDNSPHLNALLDLPRKWFYLPINSGWIEIIGKNIGGKENIATRFPGTYCIVADYIEKDPAKPLGKIERQRCLEICDDLDYFIDPHINNFMYEKNNNKLVIVDTEHFPSLVGFKERKKTRFNNYTQYYLHLAKKCTDDLFCRTKHERRMAQVAPHDLALSYDDVTKRDVMPRPIAAQ